MLDKEYVVKCCRAAWDRLRRTVEAKGSYLKPKDILERVNEESDSDE